MDLPLALTVMFPLFPLPLCVVLCCVVTGLFLLLDFWAKTQGEGAESTELSLGQIDMKTCRNNSTLSE